MENLNLIYTKSHDVKAFSKNYFNYLKQLLDSVNLDSISRFVEEMFDARKNNNTVFVIGNGGSAATASHMANDFGVDVRKNTNTKLPFRVLSLVDNASVMSAIANDDGYEKLFVNQLQIHYRQGDKLIAISASGNSPNVVNAAKWVKEQGGKVISLVGFSGGKLMELSDIAIYVKSQKGEYGPVEDIHMIMGHLLALWLQFMVQKEG